MHFLYSWGSPPSLIIILRPILKPPTVVRSITSPRSNSIWTNLIQFYTLICFNFWNSNSVGRHKRFLQLSTFSNTLKAHLFSGLKNQYSFLPGAILKKMIFFISFKIDLGRHIPSFAIKNQRNMIFFGFNQSINVYFSSNNPSDFPSEKGFGQSHCLHHSNVTLCLSQYKTDSSIPIGSPSSISALFRIYSVTAETGERPGGHLAIIQTTQGCSFTNSSHWWTDVVARRCFRI